MKAFTLILFLLVPACIFGQTTSQNSSGPDIGTLKTLLGNGTIAKVTVLHIPDSVLTRVAVTTEVLRAIDNTKSNIKKTYSQNIKETFGAMLDGLLVKHENHQPDLRWGVLFYDDQDHEIASFSSINSVNTAI